MAGLFNLILPAKASSDGWGGGWFGRGRHTTAGIVVDEDTSLNYSAVWGCTRILAETASCLPVDVFERGDDDHRQSVDVPVGDLVSVSPNPNMTAMPFRESLTAAQVNWGNGFAEIETDMRTGAVIGLWPIAPWRVSPSRDPAYAYEIRNDTGPSTFLYADEMLHIPGALSPDGIWGRGVIQHARESIGFGIATERHGAAFFGSGAQPKGLIVSPGLSGQGIRQKEDRAQFRREWDEQHSRPGNHAVAILPAGSSYTPYHISNEDSQFLGTRLANQNVIAGWYRVPPHMLGLLDRATNANVEAMGIEFVIYSLYPWVRRWEQQLNFKLFSVQQRKKMYFEHIFASLLRGDIMARMEAYRKAIMTGIMTINECRRLENLNGIGKAGDDHYVPLNMTTAQRMNEGDIGPARVGFEGPGSDQSGSPADDPPGSTPASFDQWSRQQGKLRHAEIARAMAATERDLPERKVDYREGARLTLADALERMLSREANAAKKAAADNVDFGAWLREFHGKYAESHVKALRPACWTLGLAGVTEWSTAENLAAMLRARSVEMLQASYDSDTKETFARKLAAWPTERAAQLTDEILGAA